MVVGDRSRSRAGPEHRQPDRVMIPVAQGHGVRQKSQGTAVATVPKVTSKAPKLHSLCYFDPRHR